MFIISCIAMFLSIVSGTVPSMGDTMDSSRITNQIETNHASEKSVDSMCFSFVDDTITFPQPQMVSQIVYAEHKESPNVFYGIIFPIIMLIIGVAIDRSAQVLIDKRRMKKNGKRWKNELDSCVLPIQKQRDALANFIHDYCDNPQRYDIPNILVFPMLKGTSFLSLNKEDLFDYLECKKDPETSVQDRFYKITTFVMSLEIIHQSFLEAYNSFKQSSSQQIEVFNKVHLDYSQLLLAASSKVPGEMTEGDYGRLMELFDNAFSTCPNVNLFNLEVSFISPSLSVLSHYSKLDYKNMNDKLIEMRQCINGLVLEKGYLKDNLLSVIEQYSLCLSALEVIRDYFPSDKK